MYIKKVRKKNKGSDTYYEYLHLVDSIRTENGPRQRLILNLGAIDIASDQYKALANCIEGMLNGQNTLLSHDSAIEKYATDAVRQIIDKQSEEVQEVNPEPEYQLVDLNSIEAAEPRSIGAEYVCHKMWNHLKFNEVLLESGVSSEQLPLFEALVVGRLVAPGSELQTIGWTERSAIYELTGKPLRDSQSSFYRAGDILLSCKDALESHLSKKEKELFSLPERLCLFDLTNTYFEGNADNNSKASRGHSKEKRTDCKLTTLALIVDESGFAKYSQLYPGNQYEGHTLVEMIESLTKARPDLASDRTVVIDAGIANEKNIQYLHANEFHYIVVDRGNSSDMDTNDMNTIRENENGVQVEVKRYEKEGEVYLLCRSAGRKEKDKSIRTRQEDIFLERIKFYQGGLEKKGRTKRYSKIIEMIGRLREKYPRASKMYDIEVIPADIPLKDKSVNAKEIICKKREEYEKAGKRDGCYLLRMDRNDLSDKEIWETYVMLTKVEKAFRNLKSSLGLRPNFHQKEERADAHMFISILAYHILHAIEHSLRKTGDYRSWDSIKAVLSTHQRLTIEYNQKTQNGIQRHHIRLCSKAEPEHKKIYEALGLNFIPLPKKYYSIQNE